jgi:hypothetical protein
MGGVYEDTKKSKGVSLYGCFKVQQQEAMQWLQTNAFTPTGWLM